MNEEEGDSMTKKYGRKRSCQTWKTTAEWDIGDGAVQTSNDKGIKDKLAFTGIYGKLHYLVMKVYVRM